MVPSHAVYIAQEHPTQKEDLVMQKKGKNTFQFGLLLASKLLLRDTTA